MASGTVIPFGKRASAAASAASVTASSGGAESAEDLAQAAAAAVANRARLERMFRAHHEVVWRSLRRRGLPPEAAADVTQQCFLIVAERLGDVRPESERAFLLGTAMRLGAASLRSSRRLQLEDDMERHVPLQGGPDALDQRRGAVAVLDRVLGRLHPDLVEVLVLFEVEELPAPEIANILGIPVGTVASRVRRAREAFRAAIARLETTSRREVGE